MLLCVAIAGLALAACGPIDEPADPDADTDLDAPRDDGAAAPDEILVWADPDLAPALEAALADVVDETGADTVVAEMPLTEIEDRLAAGEAPDLATARHHWLAELVPDGHLGPLAVEFDDAALLDPAVEAFSWDGERYGLPFAVDSVALVTATDVADEPASWSDLVAQASELVDAGAVEHGLAVTTEPPDPYALYPLVTAHGGYLFGRDATGGYDGGDLGIDHPGSAEAAELLADLVGEGLIDPDASLDMVEARLATGETAFALLGPGSLDAISTASIAVGPIPSPGEADAAPFVEALGLVTPAGSEAHEATPALVAALAEPEAQRTLAEAAGLPPASYDAGAALAEERPELAGFAESAARGQPLPSLPVTASAWSPWSEAYARVLDGDDPSAAMDDAAAEFRALTP